MSCMPDMTSTSLTAAIALRTGKIIKNGLRIFEGRESYTTLCIFSLVNRQKSCYKVRIYTDEKTDFSEKGLDT